MKKWVWQGGDTFKIGGTRYKLVAESGGLRIQRVEGPTVGGSFVGDVMAHRHDGRTYGEHWLEIGTDFKHRERKIRATHHYGFRCGEWAELIGEMTYPHIELGVVKEYRRCYLVRFHDGVLDAWVKEDPADPYEFAEVEDEDGWGKCREQHVETKTALDTLTLQEQAEAVNKAIEEFLRAYLAEIEKAFKAMTDAMRKGR